MPAGLMAAAGGGSGGRGGVGAVLGRGVAVAAHRVRIACAFSLTSAAPPAAPVLFARPGSDGAQRLQGEGAPREAASAEGHLALQLGGPALHAMEKNSAPLWWPPLEAAPNIEMTAVKHPTRCACLAPISTMSGSCESAFRPGAWRCRRCRPVYKSPKTCHWPSLPRGAGRVQPHHVARRYRIIVLL